jgi:hypothetical protein
MLADVDAAATAAEKTAQEVASMRSRAPEKKKRQK